MADPRRDLSPAARAYEAVRRSVELLRGQRDGDDGAHDDIERSILKEALRVARRLLQRIELDYAR